MLVPSPSFRSMAGGIMLAVVFVLAATLTLLPLVLFKLDHRINKLALPWAQHQRAPLAAVRRLGRAALERPVAVGLGVARRAARPRRPGPRPEDRDALDQGRCPRTPRARVGYDLVQDAFGDGAPGTLQIVVDRRPTPTAAAAVLAADAGIAGAMPAACRPPTARPALIQAVPDRRPVRPRAGRHRRPAARRPARLGAGRRRRRWRTSTSRPSSTTPPRWSSASILALGFLLLLVALQAPLIALLGTLASLLSTAAAFGVARLIFQEGYGAGLLGFEPQGFLDAWAPVFFFAMIFAIAMDYTVFLLASAKEHYERPVTRKEAMVGALAHSGRVIFAAGAVMVAVFFTFALSGPLPPKEMGIVLGVAVLLDAFLVRLVLLPVLLRLTGTRRLVGPRLAQPGPARHQLLPRLTHRHPHPERRSTTMCRAVPARPAARPPGPAAASTSTRSWPASPPERCAGHPDRVAGLPRQALRSLTRT